MIFGSASKGNFSWNSDFDILIIIDTISTDWFERNLAIMECSSGSIDIFSYTSGEFIQMIREKHPLILEVLHTGNVIVNDEIFEKAKILFNSYLKKGEIKPAKNGWIIMDHSIGAWS